MSKKVTWFNTSNEIRSEWENICPVNEFRIIPPSELPPIIPAPLIEKTDSIFIVSSGSQYGQILYMANMHRVDYKDFAIDQQPFGVVFQGSKPATSGCLLHHGNWENRTVHPPDEFWMALQSSGIGNLYPFSELPSTNMGNVSELKVTSQHAAFSKLVKTLKNASLLND